MQNNSFDEYQNRSSGYAISDETALSFLAAYMREFEEVITKEDARAMLQRLVALYEVLLGEE